MFVETAGSAHRAELTNGELNDTDIENSTGVDIKIFCFHWIINLDFIWLWSTIMLDVPLRYVTFNHLSSDLSVIICAASLW